MEKFTKKWDNYINLKWKEYLTPKKISVIYPNEIYDGIFNNDLLNQEFEKYYDSKQKYCSMYDCFKETFEDYEKIELLSKEEEYTKYVNTVNNKAKQLKDDFIKKISEYSEDDFKNYNINKLEDFDIETADFKLLALGKINLATRDVYRKSMPQYKLILSTENTDQLYNVILDIDTNKFLTSYEEFFNNKGIKYIDEINDFYTDEYKILDFNIQNNNIVIKVLNDNSEVIELNFKNATTDDEFNKQYNINNQEISITTHYIKQYSDCYYIVFNLIIRYYESSNLIVKNDKIEISYKNLDVSITNM